MNPENNRRDVQRSKATLEKSRPGLKSHLSQVESILTYSNKLPVVDNGGRGYKIMIPTKYDESKKLRPQNIKLNKNESIFSTEQDAVESKLQLADNISIRNIKNLVDSSTEQIRYSQKTPRGVKKNASTGEN